MDTPPPPTPLPLSQPSLPDPSELEEQVVSLQRLVGTVLVLLLIISGTFSIWLFWQVRTENRELEAGRQQLQQVIKIEAQQNEVVKRMQDFGRAHPDFLPILGKYGLAPEGSGASAPGSTPPAIAPKK
jgi:hypothetical protein